MDESEELEPLPIITEDQLAKHSKDEVVRRIAELEEAVGKMKPNMNAIREFRKKDLEYQVGLVNLRLETFALPSLSFPSSPCPPLPCEKY